MNAPTLYDRFIVPEGHRKVAFVPDTKVASAGTFTVQREDHTLGNLIRMCGRRGARVRLAHARPRASPKMQARLAAPAARRQLHTDDKVLFAGYQLPHPLVNELKIKARARGRQPRCRAARLRRIPHALLTAVARTAADPDAAGRQDRGR